METSTYDTITYTVPTMRCRGCQRTIERGLGALPGVHGVSIDLPAKSVAVHFNPAHVTPDQIKTALVAKGHRIE